MTDLVSCPQCDNGFLTPPEPCPACGAPAPAAAAPDPRRGRDRVVSSRLNQTARVGGILIAGLLTGSVSWFLVSREMGAGLVLLALLASAAILWRR